MNQPWALTHPLNKALTKEGVPSMSSLSVMLPNYNHAQYVAQAIEAIVTQSRPPDEFIIIDDASTDNSFEIISSYASRYSYIRLERNERNLGSITTSRRLTNMATGEYLYAAAADDYVLPGFFETGMAMAEQYPQAGIICGQQTVIDANDNKLGVGGIPRWTTPRFVSPRQFLEDYLEKEVPNHCLSSATIYKRTSLEEVGGFRPELVSWCDIFAIRAIALRHGACYIPQACTCYRPNPNSFASSTLADVGLMFEIIARATDLMRSTQFNSYFPEEHVVRWEQNLRSLVIRCHISRLRKEFGENVLKRFALLSPMRASQKKLSDLLFLACKVLATIWLVPEKLRLARCQTSSSSHDLLVKSTDLHQ